MVRNCSPQLPWETKLVHLNKHMVRIRWAGYGFGTREIIATRILAKVESDQRNFSELGRPLYRNKEQRAQAPKVDKANWFRDGGATTTLTVPVTKRSELAKRLRLVVANSKGPRGTSVKVVEKPGPPLLQGIALSNPFMASKCHKGNCPLEETGSDCLGKCSLESVVYTAVCTHCEDKQEEEEVPEKDRVQYLYIGETSRTLRTRSSQHLKDYKKCRNTDWTTVSEEEGPSSFMWDHRREVHGGQYGMDPDKDFRFGVLARNQDPLTRQTVEAVRIKLAVDKGKHIDKSGNEQNIHTLNRKSEIFAPRERFISQSQ